MIPSGNKAAATLLVGFDSAWTAAKSGALAGVLRFADGTFQELGSPQAANFSQAQDILLEWQASLAPESTFVFLDQPTVVANLTGQRPVENLVGSAVSRRLGGMQPANRSREEMFGAEAPIWPFLTQFGGPANPIEPALGTNVFETYPVLAIIALLWTLPHTCAVGRLPKYNPERRTTFSMADWRRVCGLLTCALKSRGLTELSRWTDEIGRKPSPAKRDQDSVDACLCLLVALHFIEGKRCLMIGNLQTATSSCRTETNCF
jgi:predicted RNase H-like nuclease